MGPVTDVHFQNPLVPPSSDVHEPPPPPYQFLSSAKFCLEFGARTVEWVLAYLLLEAWASPTAKVPLSPSPQGAQVQVDCGLVVS